MPEQTTADPSRRERLQRWQDRWQRWHLHPWGLVAGTIGFTLGLTPSLLPRTFLYQSLVSGLAAAVFYGVGVFLYVVWDLWVRDRLAPKLAPTLERIPQRWRTRLDVALMVAALLWLVIMVVFSLRWQRGIAELTESEPYSLWQFLLIVPIGVAVWVGLLLLARGIRWLVRKLAGLAPSWLHPSAGAVTSWLAALIVGILLVEQIIPGAIVRGAEMMLANQYREPEEGITQPVIEERSGVPGSHAEWEGLGQYGMRFVNQGLYREQLEELTGEPAKEPIRVYVGLHNAPSNAERAQILIDELIRTGATEREAMVLNITTGTGWVNPQAAQAFELLHNGDTAYAAAQYSYLPSALHFLAGGEDVINGGRELITPIIDWWNTLPEDDRPELYLYGESLGATGVESAFSGIRDITNSVDGILMAGPPNFNPLWQAFVERRDPGTREVSPVYAGGRMIRFAQNPAEVREFADDPTPWGPTRVLYLQHASDPVTWWSTDLIFREPDWLEEPAGFDRLPAMTWMPVITFLQVSADLPMAQGVPDGHGHNYGDSMLDGFAAVDGGFTVEQVDELKPLLADALEISGDSDYNPAPDVPEELLVDP